MQGDHKGFVLFIFRLETSHITLWQYLKNKKKKNKHRFHFYFQLSSLNYKNTLFIIITIIISAFITQLSDRFHCTCLFYSKHACLYAHIHCQQRKDRQTIRTDTFDNSTPYNGRPPFNCQHLVLCKMEKVDSNPSSKPVLIRAHTHRYNITYSKYILWG